MVKGPRRSPRIRTKHAPRPISYKSTLVIPPAATQGSRFVYKHFAIEVVVLLIPVVVLLGLAVMITHT